MERRRATRSRRWNLFAVFLGSALALLFARESDAGATGSITGYVSPGGWTADLFWTVSFPDGADVVTLAWSSSNGKHGSKLVRGHLNETHAVLSGQGDVVWFRLARPTLRWDTVNVPADVVVQ